MGSYDEICSQLHQEFTTVYIKPCDTTDPSKWFFTQHAVHKIMDHERLNKWYGSFLKRHWKEQSDALGIWAKEWAATFADVVVEKGLQPFFATLIFASCGPEVIKSSIQKLVLRPNPDDGFGVLPLQSERIQYLFNNDNANFNKFIQYQPCFCTAIIIQGESQNISHMQRLPYLEEKPRGVGGSGSVFEVQIAPGHYRTDRHRDEMGQGKPKLLARKDFKNIKNSGQGFKNEIHIFEQLFQSSKSCKYVVTSHASLVYNEEIFSIFLPLAEFDLQTYMKTERPQGPRDDDTIRAELVEVAKGLAAGLDFLHWDLKGPSGKRIQCFHMDLKPGNVLIFKQSGKLIWKISDFNMSKVKGVKAQRENSDNDFTPMFEDASATSNPPGSCMTYRAPECRTRLGRQTVVESDIWSLGGILSVMFAYMDNGYKGVEEYANLRVKNSQTDVDTFFRFESSSSSTLNPAVRQQHKIFAKNEKKRSGIDLNSIFEFIESKTLNANPVNRPRASKVQQEMFEVLGAYQGKAPQPPPPELVETESPVPPRRGIQRIREMVHSKFQRRGRSGQDAPHCEPEVLGWRIDAEGQITGCHMAALDATAAFWDEGSDLMPLSVYFCYRNEGTGKDRVMKVERNDRIQKQSGLRRPFSSAFVASECVFAVSQALYFQCSMFVFSKKSWYHMKLELSPPISSLAVSPRAGAKVACVVGGKHPRLYMARVTDLVRFYDPSRSSSDSPSPHPWKSVKLPPWIYNERYVGELEFVSEDMLYIVVNNRSHAPPAAARDPSNVVVLGVMEKVGKDWSRLDSDWVWKTLHQSKLGGKNITAVAPLLRPKRFAILVDEYRLSVYEYSRSRGFEDAYQSITIPGQTVKRIAAAPNQDRVIVLQTDNRNRWSVHDYWVHEQKKQISECRKKPILLEGFRTSATRYRQIQLRVFFEEDNQEGEGSRQELGRGSDAGSDDHDRDEESARADGSNNNGHNNDPLDGEEEEDHEEIIDGDSTDDEDRDDGEGNRLYSRFESRPPRRGTDIAWITAPVEERKRQEPIWRVKLGQVERPSFSGYN